ncbi:MAG: M50 family metallopeptidase [Eubacterium sp.]|nr:M50 family metallopeptidase [Eubacterium sp.]
MNIFYRALWISIIFILVGLVISLCCHLANGITFRIIQIIAGANTASLILNYLTYPGVVHHELSHALLAFLTGAKVKRIVLHRQGNSLGHVEYCTTGLAIRSNFQKTMTSLAPVYVGVITLSILNHFRSQSIMWAGVVIIYLMICIFYHMSLSRVDLRTAAKGIPAGFVAIYVIVLLVLGVCHIYAEATGTDITASVMATIRNTFNSVGEIPHL